MLNVTSNNSSLAYSVTYHFDNDGICIYRTGGLIGENEFILLKRGFYQEEGEKILSIVRQLSAKSLAGEYTNPLTEDGNQLKIEFVIDGMNKAIIIRNVYQEDVSILINSINQCLPNELRIVYLRR
jgi:hypothetical protein